ncbi:MAG: replication-relaxation family protein [Gammaproteobacteria bacterium]|nr:replication-relaxation family protein [Gammaproteobacteria bacterium]
MLVALAGIPLADIPTVARPEALEPRYVNHQLAVNSCMLAIRQACRPNPGVTLREWTADPHARMRYQVGRSWRMVHPDAIAEIAVDGRCRWIYLEVGRGTAELPRYARFYLSGSWRREYATFPEVRIVTAHHPRVRRVMAEMEKVVRSFSRAGVVSLAAGLVVAVAREWALLADSSGAVSRPKLAADRVESPLLPFSNAAVTWPAASES